MEPNHALVMWRILLTTGYRFRIAQGLMDPSWSPARNEIIGDRYPDGSTPTELYVIAPDGRELRRLTSNEFFDARPIWSFDGNWVCWEIAGAGYLSDGLWTMEHDGTSARRIAGPGCSLPSWSPDGRQMVFMGYNVASNSETLWWMNSDGTNPRQLTAP
jgi:TolB protein